MADNEHLGILWQGVEVWNRWREENPDIMPYLTGANLLHAELIGADLAGANLRDANLIAIDLTDADLRWADLSGARLVMAKLRGANLIGADLTWANLIYADMSGADLTDANMSCAQLVETKIVDVILSNCKVYGISAWRLEGIPKGQSNLIITRDDEPVITVDNLEVAQFIYLLLHSPKIRDVIDTIARKAVLILGRFTDERKTVLDAIRDELRKQDYLPIVFDFDGPASRDTAETISTLAHLSRFIIADITEPRSVPAELAHVVEKLPSVAVQPLMLSSDYEYELFKHIKRYPWVLPVYLYDSQEMLLANLKEGVIDPAEAKAKELIPPAANR